jgi:hypothetical protein
MNEYLVIISDHAMTFPRSHAADFCALCGRTQAPHLNRRFYGMTPIEADIIELLRLRGPCCLDDVVRDLSNLSWGEVFGALDRMSRDGRVLVHRDGYSTYQIALQSQVL